MKFYGRENEIKLLNSVQIASKKNAQMTFIVGRRRIGKTRLLLHVFKSSLFIYLFVSKKSEKLLCQEYVDEVQKKLKLPFLGEFKSFSDLFEMLMHQSETQSFTLIIDEFQEFLSINGSIYSKMQDIWDRHKEKSKMNLILTGSTYSLMKRIFENAKEPLFGRATAKIHLKPFTGSTLKLILAKNNTKYANTDLLAFYILTGGVAKYVELFVDKNCLFFKEMINEIFRTDSYFIDEGKNLMIEEFGRDYTTYFSILTLISSGKTARNEIESILEKSVGGFLEKLANDYNIINKIKPFNAKPNSRIQKYEISDSFLNFWFRFFYKYRAAVEIENFDYLKQIVFRDFNTFSGRYLEKYFIEKLALSKKYSTIGSYWEKGNKNQIDIVAINDLKKSILFAEVKLNRKKINLSTLKEKSTKLLLQFPEYKYKYAKYSIEDM